MNAKLVLVVAVAFFLLGVGAFFGAAAFVFAGRGDKAPRSAGPAPSVTATPLPTGGNPGPTVAVNAADPAPVAGPRPMRPELGLSVSDSDAITHPIEIGHSSIGIVDRAPRIAGVVGGSPAAKGGLRPGDHIYEVDGHSCSSVADFEHYMGQKTIPGEVVIRAGPTSSESHDLRIQFK